MLNIFHLDQDFPLLNINSVFFLKVSGTGVDHIAAQKLSQ